MVSLTPTKLVLQLGCHGQAPQMSRENRLNRSFRQLHPEHRLQFPAVGQVLDTLPL